MRLILGMPAAPDYAPSPKRLERRYLDRGEGRLSTNAISLFI